MFTNKPSIDRSKMTFSQTEGIDPLPQPTMLGELSTQVRCLLWGDILESIRDAIRYEFGGTPHLNPSWKEILYDFHVSNSKLADEFDDRFESNARNIKKLLIEEKYNRVFDFLEFVLRHEFTPTTLSESVARVFDDKCAYTIIEDGPRTSVVPVAIPEQRESTKTAFQALASGPFGGLARIFWSRRNVSTPVIMPEACGRVFTPSSR